MNTYHLYNKSSAVMSECASDSVDLIVTSPPYNIGTQYGANADSLGLEEYKTGLSNCLAECYRVLKDDGQLYIEVADSVAIDGVYLQLASLVADMFRQAGFSLQRRDINFVLSENGALLPDHGWNSDFKSQGNAHANCHHRLVLTKTKTDFAPDGVVTYQPYPKSEDHPCPFTDEFINLVLNLYFKPGNCVLDPFMGTAILGQAVVRRGGIFIGYELDETIFHVAERNMQGAQR